MASPKIGRQLEKVMRDWRGIKAAIGDRVFYVSVDAAHGQVAQNPAQLALHA